MCAHQNKNLSLHMVFSELDIGNFSPWICLYELWMQSEFSKFPDSSID